MKDASFSYNTDWRCLCEPADRCLNGTADYCITKSHCFGMLRLVDDNQLEHIKGCTDDKHLQQLEDDADPTHPHLFLCNVNTNRMVVKCCQGDRCNSNLTLSLPQPPFTHEQQAPIRLIVAVVVPVLSLLILTALLAISCHYYRRKRHSRSVSLDDARALTGDNVTDPDWTGSGFGTQRLVPQTVAQHIRLGELIGQGRYGQVYRGEYLGGLVAVKVFPSRDELSWSREKQIYSNVLLRHENILGFIASDTTSHDSITQLWLITHYHRNGSLYDFLVRQPVYSYDIMFRLLTSAAAGLQHLHTEIFGSEAKPAIAHRDVKSRNILVKDDFTCCVADLGLAVMQIDDKMDIGQNPRVGTKRYMAPEVLDQSIDVTSIESFKAADVYAFGLVVWEVARRLPLLHGQVDDYQPPFWDTVPSDPSFDDMRKVVCSQRMRPSIPAMWIKDPIMSEVCQVMQECWHQLPSHRLSMLRVKKQLQLTQQQVCLLPPVSPPPGGGAAGSVGGSSLGPPLPYYYPLQPSTSGGLSLLGYPTANFVRLNQRL